MMAAAAPAKKNSKASSHGCCFRKWMREFDMKFTMILTASAVVLTSSLALAQNVSTGSTTSSGDSAVSPAAGNPTTDSPNGPDRRSPGAGINSGAMNNGTTGDTIGTGSGTPRVPATGQATTT